MKVKFPNPFSISLHHISVQHNSLQNGMPKFQSSSSDALQKLNSLLPLPLGQGSKVIE